MLGRQYAGTSSQPAKGSQQVATPSSLASDYVKLNEVPSLPSHASTSSSSSNNRAPASKYWELPSSLDPVVATAEGYARLEEEDSSMSEDEDKKQRKENNRQLRLKLRQGRKTTNEKVAQRHNPKAHNRGMRRYAGPVMPRDDPMAFWDRRPWRDEPGAFGLNVSHRATQPVERFGGGDGGRYEVYVLPVISSV